MGIDVALGRLVIASKAVFPDGDDGIEEEGAAVGAECFCVVRSRDIEFRFDLVEMNVSTSCSALTSVKTYSAEKR